MANPEHTKMLLQGIEAFYRLRHTNPEVSKDINKIIGILDEAIYNWNKWRKEHTYSKLDLSNIDLHGPNKSGLYLWGANLRSINFSKSNLSHALLMYADVADSNLESCDLSNTNLMDAKFSYSNLRNASLCEANLMHTNFAEALLQGSDFTGAELGWTIFAATDLSEAIGLDAVSHSGPSEIGISTLYISKSQIPESFLRGCGLKDWEIEAAKLYRPDLTPGQASEILYKVHELRTNPAIQFNSCFISYSSKNHDFAERLYVDLQNKGVRCWFTPEDIKIGDKFRQRIDEAIRIHDKLLVILSEDSISSAWVEEEVESAIEREHREKRLVLFPVRIDEAVINSDQAWASSLRRMRHIGDFSKWKDHDSYQKAFARLLRDLKAEELK